MPSFRHGLLRGGAAHVQGENCRAEEELPAVHPTCPGGHGRGVQGLPGPCRTYRFQDVCKGVRIRSFRFLRSRGSL